MPSKELNTMECNAELNPPEPVPSDATNPNNNSNEQPTINEPELPHNEELPPELQTPREITQTDHLNKRLLKSFLAHLNATNEVMQHFAGHVPNATPAGVEEDDFEEQLLYGTQIM